MTAPLADLRPGKRKEYIRVALDVRLRSLKAPTPTAEVVKALAADLGEPKATHLIARALVDIAPEHPAASQTGEPFQRFGRTMRRWEWRPLGRTKRESAADIEARRARQRALEEDDEWTVHPADPGGFLEDDDV